MFVARCGFGSLSKTAVATVNPVKVVKRVVWLAAMVTIMCVAVAAQSLNASFTEYRTPTPNGQPYGIVVGPDGALWFAESNVHKIGRITTAGVITEYSLPPALSGASCASPSTCGPYNMTTGSDGALWFSGFHEIGRLTTAGSATLFPIQGGSNGITAGPDGALWFTEGPATAGGGAAIGRITTNGTVTEYRLPNGSGPNSIISGPDGAMWFTDVYTGVVGQITTAGAITLYPVPHLVGPGDYGRHIAVGPDGALWFGEASFIGRITTAGALTEYPITGVQVPNQITKGPDGAMWFTTYTANRLGRATAIGAVTMYEFPPLLSGALGITLGPDGALWISGGEGSLPISAVLRVQVPARTGVLSHIAAGSGWDTTITLVNTSSSAVPTRLAFYADDGSALSLPLTVTQQGVSQGVTGSTLDRVIGPNTTLLVDTGTQLTSTVVGWADVTSVGPVGGYAIFRQTPQTGSPSEGTVPLQSQFPSTVTLAYDNTAGFVMGVALANLSTSSASITATMWDDSGNLLGTQTITIAGSGHTAFVLPNQLTLTTGRRGIVQFQSAATGGITGLGLRFSPFGTFTSVPTM